MLEGITLASLLTAAGAGIAAAIVTLFVDVLKVPFTTLNGVVAAFIASAVLYVAAFLSVANFTLEGGFEAFIAWLTCAAAAFGLHKTVLASVSNGITAAGAKLTGGAPPA